MIWEQFLYNFMVLLNGPVKNTLFCLMDRYRNVCVWFMARNCRFPKVGTHGCQRGNHRLPLQGAAGSQSLELLVPNLGTMGYHCKELPFPKGWNWWFPTWQPKVTMARNCRFPDLETYGSQPGNQRLPLQGIAGSQKLEFLFSKLSNYHYVRNCRCESLKLMVPNLKKHALPVEGSVDSKKFKLMVLNVVSPPQSGQHPAQHPAQHLCQTS